MINISKLYCEQVTPGDWLRYGMKGSGERAGEVVPKKASERKPIVVWNYTSKCNLKCVHCYNDSGMDKASNESTTEEAKAILDDLAEFGVPSVLFSGGEPFVRKDLFELIRYAGGKGLRTVISTNGTMITPEAAKTIKDAGVSYVGISLDGIGEVNDKFRGVKGAFDSTVKGIRNCMAAGVRVGLRLTLTKRNVQDLEPLFDFLDAENIERLCFYHLVPSGRGEGIFSDDDLTHAQSRDAIEKIMAKTRQLKEAGKQTDILTVDNHVDGIYLYLKLLKEDPEKAAKVWELLTWNGGGMNSSGVGIGCIDFNGKVHANQFWGHYDLGDVHEKKFSEIWSDNEEPLLKGLRDRRGHVKGRCRVCKFFDACGGSLRVRADLHFGDTWAPDPGCYLTDEEIGLDDAKIAELKDCGEWYEMPL
ncbi:MAG: radical SAM protein [Anaerohalosphaera sp.]|nr:radical SAM protein [Anaerohalosphaera sp.]